MSAYTYNLPQLFRSVVAENRERPAIHFSGRTAISYGRFDELSNQAARLFSDRGVGPGSAVCICTEKTLVPYVAMFGALKAGALYFALDPKNPASRIHKILDQCSPDIIVSDTEMEYPGYEGKIIRCGEWFDEFPIASGFDSGPVECSTIDGFSAAYVMFTSGSTGAPKGAVINHNNLVHFANWAREEYQFTSEDRHTHLNPLYFDNSVFDIYSTLLSGGCLVPFCGKILSDPSAIVDRIEEMECTTWFSVPSLLMYLQVMKQVRGEPFRSLTRIIFGGEGYPKIKLKELYDELGHQTRLINVYGPTECTCICSSHVITSKDFENLEGLPTLGQLIPNFRGYVLNDNSETPIGETGELCLGGPCVGMGYFNQSQQTEKAFVQNPLNTNFPEVIYRTGDLVRRDPRDGQLHFVGRKDLQIKHQGYRIELEEIQHALLSLEGVDEAVALHRNADGGSRLSAVVASSGGVDLRDLKRKLSACVPSYMVPDRIHVVKALPKNANGKTDRQALMAEFGDR